MGPMIHYLPIIYVVLLELHQMKKNISLNRTKVHKSGIWDMFHYSLNYIQWRPTQNIPQQKQPAMKLKQPSLQSILKYTISSVICIENESITN
jgi:hypothetical protein